MVFRGNSNYLSRMSNLKSTPSSGSRSGSIGGRRNFSKHQTPLPEATEDMDPPRRKRATAPLDAFDGLVSFLLDMFGPCTGLGRKSEPAQKRVVPPRNDFADDASHRDSTSTVYAHRSIQKTKINIQNHVTSFSAPPKSYESITEFEALQGLDSRREIRAESVMDSDSESDHTQQEALSQKPRTDIQRCRFVAYEQRNVCEKRGTKHYCNKSRQRIICRVVFCVCVQTWFLFELYTRDSNLIKLSCELYKTGMSPSPNMKRKGTLVVAMNEASETADSNVEIETHFDGEELCFLMKK
jgi:hypothetical protein